MWNMKVVVIEVKGYLNETKLYFRDILINLQKSDAWKIQLITAINFISSKDVDEERVIHLKSNNIEFMPYNNELFELLLSGYQIGLATSMKEQF